ncbi:MAG TPA: NAD-dependent succinate-semialdehyde dehydrogenase [Rhizomicrobium sp.]
MNAPHTDTPRRLNLKDPSLFIDKAYVAGEWIGAPDGKTMTITDPFDGAVLARVPDLGVEALRRAIDAAHIAQKEWAKKTVKERAQVLRRWFDLVIANADDLALILTSEQGKPLAEAKGEIITNAAYLEWFAEEAKRIDGDVIPSPRGDQRMLVLKQPLGVCAAITPWNFPNGMITRKVAPALAAGCTMVLKPAPQTPLSALALAVLGERAGVPKGCFSVVTGEAKPIGEEFCHNPKIAKITFTGSTAVGAWLMREASGQIKRLSLELGGNAPFIVFDDADLDAAVEGAVASKYRNAGQTCISANRIYLQDSIHDAFVEKLKTRIATLKLGHGTEEGVQMGPLIDAKALTKMQDHLKDALAQGGTLVAGGRQPELGGTFFEPTIVTGVTQAMKVAREETFAPLAPIIRFKSEEEVIAMANATQFGLAAYFYARDLSRVWRVAEQLETGMVGVNTPMIVSEMAPFGGAKQSGLGREGSKYGIESYLELKLVCMSGI